MKIENCKYIKRLGSDEVFQIKAKVDGEELWIPMSKDNRHYTEILKQVKEGKLTIKDAD
tara:strand:+ start:84 stop:260 length:177 start_codon:yes stop_codon:yes gene_type:complete